MKEVNSIKDRLTYLANAQAIQGDENRLKIAQNILDRLFISNSLSVEEMTDIIKNELSSILNLSKEEIQLLLNDYETKGKIVNDKLKLAEMKIALSNIKVTDEKITEMIRKEEIKEISQKLIESNFVSNQKLLFDFIMQDSCNHFKLSYEEKLDVVKEVKQWMRKKLRIQY